MIQVTKATQFHNDTVAMNEALVLSSLRQQELVGLTEELNAKLRREIIERKLAEATLHESEARYRALFEMGPVAIYSCDASGVILDFNRRAAELWGRDPAAGGNNERFCGSFKILRPNGDYVPHEEGPMAEVLSGNIPEARDVEVHVEQPDGTRITAIVNIRPLKNQRGKITGAINSFFDVTERHAAQDAVRASEARFRMLFEFIDEGFCTLGKLDTGTGEPSDFRYLSANAGFEKQTGVGGVVGKTIREAFPDEPQEWFDTYDAVMATGEPVRFERELASQGRTLELFAFRFEDEAVLKIGVIFLDVSLRKHHVEQQELLLNEMDHRIKNLFAIVGGMVTLSARSATTPKELAQTIQGRLGALASAHQLIRPGHSVAPATKRETTLGDLIQKVLSPYADPVGTGDSARTEFDGPEIAVGAEAATNIALVVHELATNAAKYGALSVSGGRVRISWVVAKGRLTLSWEEKGGPVITAPPKREGFGSVLARRSVNGGLWGDLAFHWYPNGLVVLISAETERLAR
ncbi:sensor histidine kinase [Brevundimonas sp. DC300-4]|uniref:sensor histidine kinase n=1 Tax=Brevundimonas sp. DC300-4 TaxID=2804594 RepID=UPI003CF2615A